MASVTLIDELGKIDGLGNSGGAETWPAWTDNWYWEPNRPMPALTDEEWKAMHGADFPLTEADLDEDAAFRAAAMDCIERSLIPDDIALMLNRTSLAGSPDPDDIIHAGSDSRWCLCESCTWDRTRIYAD